MEQPPGLNLLLPEVLIHQRKLVELCQDLGTSVKQHQVAILLG